MHEIFKILALAILLVGAGCQTDPAADSVVSYLQLQGKTMGTTYQVQYADSLQRDFQQAIDSLLVQLNEEVSTYIPTSTISRFNQSETGLDLGAGAGKLPPNYHFLQNLMLSRQVFEASGGAFDPTVMPLVNYWGFGYSEKKVVQEIDSARVDSLRGLVGLQKVSLQETKLQKELPGVQLDFSGVAKGYGVDAVGRFLEEKGVGHYLVEIGGEVRAKGKNKRGEPWRIGILRPREGVASNEFEAKAVLPDLSLATSGNYRNYYEVDGRKYAHTINPKTGYPELSNLLSASVFTRDCAEADAWATAFMVMGLEKALSLAEQMEGVEAYFVYGKEDGSLGEAQTSGLSQIIEQ